MAKYKNLEKLGSGGFGEVWRCERDEDGEIFAKKVLVQNTQEAIKRFQREVRILSKLDHPRIVTVVANHLSEPPFWYAMPIYQGSLRDRLQQVAGDRKRIAKIYVSILEAIHHAHDQGIIHRDLKPENILLDEDENLVVSDFGLGLQFDATTTRATFTGQPLGTFGYMAPEQFQDAKHVDHRADIFALGKVLFELYTGVHPAAGQDLSLLPLGIMKIVDRCTKIDPAKRFQNVGELLDAFSLLETTQRKVNAPQELESLLGELIAQGFGSTEQAKLMVKLIAQCQDDATLLHEFAVKLPSAPFTALFEASPEVARLLVQQFAQLSNSQGWPYEYTDKIGGACRRLFEATLDPEIRTTLVTTALEVGVSHNRYYVMDIAASLVQDTKKNEAALSLAHALEPMSEQLEVIRDRLNVTRLHPLIQELFGSSKDD